MERKIGEIFNYNGKWYQAIEQSGNFCKDCYFYSEDGCFVQTGIGWCRHYSRNDNKSIIYKKLEKVGEPYMDGGKIMQKYKRVYREPIYFPYKELNCYNDLHGRICIEIKQTNEDMEEKKPTYEELLHYYHSTVGLWAIDRSPQEVSLDWICDNTFQLGIDEKIPILKNGGKNLKPFDLQAAKSGKPVCTRDGRKARIICFDTKGDMCPIIALVEENGIETTYHYDENGQNAYNKSELDLMMLSEKKEGWVNVYRDEESKRVYCGESIFSEREKAEKHYKCNDTKVATVSIGWEE